MYLDKNRKNRGSQSEQPKLVKKGQVLEIGGYQRFNLTKNGILNPNQKNKFEAARAHLAKLFQSGCRSLSDIGCSNGLYSYCAHFQGYEKVYALDHDVDCIGLLKSVNDHLKITNVTPIRYKFGETMPNADVGLVFSLIHWIFSCTADFFSFDKICNYLKQHIQKYLLIEWIDPEDPSVKAFKHTGYNKDKQLEIYSRENFEASLRKNFSEIVEIDSKFNCATRVLYVVRV